jgi:hypothetical protein
VAAIRQALDLAAAEERSRVARDRRPSISKSAAVAPLANHASHG